MMLFNIWIEVLIVTILLLTVGIEMPTVTVVLLTVWIQVLSVVYSKHTVPTVGEIVPSLKKRKRSLTDFMPSVLLGNALVRHFPKRGDIYSGDQDIRNQTDIYQLFQSQRKC